MSGMHCRGIDLLFCGSTHRLKKIVLHTNLPNHVSFGTYNKCHFLIKPPSTSTCRFAAETTSNSSSAQQSEVTGPSPTCQREQQAGQAQHAGQAQQQQQHIQAMCLHGDEEQHADGPTADARWIMPGHQQQNAMQQDATHLAQQHAKELHHCQPEQADLDYLQPQSEHMHDGQSQVDNDCSDWRQQGHRPVAHWLMSQAEDSGECEPGLHGSAPGNTAGLHGAFDDSRNVPANVQQVTKSATAPLLFFQKFSGIFRHDLFPASSHSLARLLDEQTPPLPSRPLRSKRCHQYLLQLESMLHLLSVG